MEPESSLPHSLQPVTCSYPESDQSSQRPPILFTKYHIVKLSPHLHLDIPTVLFPCSTHLSSSPHVPHIPPVSCFLVGSPEGYLLRNTKILNNDVIYLIKKFYSLSNYYVLSMLHVLQCLVLHRKGRCSSKILIFYLWDARQEPGTNFGSDTIFITDPSWFCSVSPFAQIPEQYLQYGMAVSFQFLSSHPTIDRSLPERKEIQQSRQKTIHIFQPYFVHVLTKMAIRISFIEIVTWCKISDTKFWIIV